MGQTGRDDMERAVLPWRLVVGIFLHFAIPFYFIVLLGAFLLSASPPADIAEGVRWLLRASGWFLGGYALTTLLAGIAAALLDPLLRAIRARRRIRHPDAAARLSERRAAEAIARIGAADWGPAAPRIAAALRHVAAEPWNHADPHGQRLSCDLSDAANAFLPALASARGDKRAEISGLAADAIERIAGAIEQLARDKSRLDEGDARTIARMISLRYGDDARPVSLDRPKGEA
jgi:HAMP domain-containing protein